MTAPGGFTPFHRGGAGPPLVCIHGFIDTWRTWELVLPKLEARHDVLAPTMAGHAGGPPLPPERNREVLADAVEAAMDDAGFETAHIAGNSLGGYVALQLAARGRAESVVALAPAGGWAGGPPPGTLEHFEAVHRQCVAAASHAEAIAASPEGRRRATQYVAERFEHIPPAVIAHQIVGVAGCEALPLMAYAVDAGYELDAERIRCPVRVVWGTEDKLLPWPSAAARFREEWVPQAEWIELDGVGHCPQLDVPLETAELIVGFTFR